MARVLSWQDLELLDELGEGQSGVVVRARLKRDVGAYPENSVVAVKRYKPWVLHERGAIDRIFSEVETGRRIEHPNVMRVLGAVLDNDGHPALVMEYCDGNTLEKLLANARMWDPLPIDTCFRYLRDIASGISCLHDHNLIHRDIKPANVIVTPSRLIVADFGVVRSKDLPEQTTTGAFLGTIRYAAPEYLFGGDYTENIDVYSFGAIAYELFTNRGVFDGETHWARVIAARANGETAIDDDARDGLAARVGFNVASLVVYILNNSRCEVRKRRLQLRSFVQAVEDEIWDTSFVADKGSIEGGLKTFPGPLKTAHEAGRAIRNAVTADDLHELCDFIRSHYWATTSVSSADLGKKLTQRLIRARALSAQRGRQTFMISLPAVVKEAFALGLLT